MRAFVKGGKERRPDRREQHGKENRRDGRRSDNYDNPQTAEKSAELQGEPRDGWQIVALLQSAERLTVNERALFKTFVHGFLPSLFRGYLRFQSPACSNAYAAR
jgi:hypothetical protein